MPANSFTWETLGSLQSLGEGTFADWVRGNNTFGEYTHAGFILHWLVQ